jgi:hypothetical protein
MVPDFAMWVVSKVVRNSQPVLSLLSSQSEPIGRDGFVRWPPRFCLASGSFGQTAVQGINRRIPGADNRLPAGHFFCKARAISVSDGSLTIRFFYF